MEAIEKQYDHDLIRFLVDLNPETTKIPSSCGKYPLRRCLEQRRHGREFVELLCTCSEAVESLDIFGRSAVQLVLEQWYSSTHLMDAKILELLFAQSPHVVHQQCSHCRLSCPIDKADACINLCYKPYRIAMAELDRAKLNNASLVQQQKTWRVVDLWWENCRVVLRALDNVNMLWAALQSSAPPSIVGLVLQENPSLIRTQNKEGDCPLHWLSSNLQYDKDKVFDLLLDADPDQAAIVSSSGQTPLHLCVQSSNFLSPWRLRRLIQSHPSALSMRHPSSHMFPFLLAASCSRNPKDEPEPDLAQLDQIFVLISMAPGLVNASSEQ